MSDDHLTDLQIRILIRMMKDDDVWQEHRWITNAKLAKYLAKRIATELAKE